jgi:hypothetical protein
MSSDNPYKSSDAAETGAEHSKISSDPSIENEPHLAKSEFAGDQTDPGDEALFPDVAAASLVDEDQLEHGVWDEPALSPKLAGPRPADALTYDRWLANGIARTSREQTWRNTLLIAVCSGPWAILGALFSQMGAVNKVLLVCLIAPLTEEVMKAAASLWVVEKRPFMFSSTSQILLCAAISGLCFAAIENVLYLHVGFRAAPPGMAIWRWTICTALHTVCALIAGYGLNRVWRQTMSTQTRPQISLATPFIVAAVLLHGAYNTAATVFHTMSEF